MGFFGFGKKKQQQPQTPVIRMALMALGYSPDIAPDGNGGEVNVVTLGDLTVYFWNDPSLYHAQIEWPLTFSQEDTMHAVVGAHMLNVNSSTGVFRVDTSKGHTAVVCRTWLRAEDGATFDQYLRFVQAALQDVLPEASALYDDMFGTNFEVPEPPEQHPLFAEIPAHLDTPEFETPEVTADRVAALYSGEVSEKTARMTVKGRKFVAEVHPAETPTGPVRILEISSFKDLPASGPNDIAALINATAQFNDSMDLICAVLDEDGQKAASENLGQPAARMVIRARCDATVGLSDPQLKGYVDEAMHTIAGLLKAIN